MDKNQFWIRCVNDRRFFFEKCLKIRTLKDGKYILVPFKLNREQDQILQKIEDMEARNIPVRIIILKSRKVGVSTLIEAVGFHYCLFNKYAQARCIAHLEKATDRIFDITRRYFDNLPDLLEKAAPGRTSGRGVRFKHGSMFEVQTQGSTDAARGDTPSFLHLSELALWENRRAQTTAEDVLQATFGAIEDEPGTWIVIESTANGPRGAFYERFRKALGGARDGNLFESLFFGWQDHHKYTLLENEGDEDLDERLREAHSNGDVAEYWRTSQRMGYPKIWAERAIEYDLKPRQVRWALQTVSTKFGGDRQRFDIEYPLSWQIAFTASGGSPVDQEIVGLRIEEIQNSNRNVLTGREMTGDGQMVPGGTFWEVYHPPQGGHHYLVTVDSATGIDKGDYACIQIYDRSARQQAAEYYAKMPPDIVAKEAAKAGRVYNDALLAPEVDGPGLALIRTLLDLNDGLGYQNLYRRSTSQNWTLAWGFKTGSQTTRDACIEAFAKAIRDKVWQINSLRLLKECQTFVQTASGRYEALKSEHDDAVMASAIAFYLDAEIGGVEEYQIVKLKAKERHRPQGAIFVSDLLDIPEHHDLDPHLGKWW